MCSAGSLTALVIIPRLGAFSYNLPVANGSYMVTLKFADSYETAPGRRIFNVVINGQTVLSNFDVYAQAGGQNIAIDKQFSVAVTNGTISIQFVPVSGNVSACNAVQVN